MAVDPLGAIKQTFFAECEEQLAELESGLLALERGAAPRRKLHHFPGHNLAEFRCPVGSVLTCSVYGWRSFDEGVSMSFLRDCRGGVAVIAGVSAIPLLVGAGIAVDFSRAHLTGARLQGATDAAVLSAAAGNGSKAERISRAEDIFAEQMAQYDVSATGAPHLTVKIEADTAEASATNPAP